MGGCGVGGCGVGGWGVGGSGVGGSGVTGQSLPTLPMTLFKACKLTKASKLRFNSVTIVFRLPSTTFSGPPVSSLKVNFSIQPGSSHMLLTVQLIAQIVGIAGSAAASDRVQQINLGQCRCIQVHQLQDRRIVGHHNLLGTPCKRR